MSAECGKVWLPADEDRWQAHLDTEDELVFIARTALNGSSATATSPALL
jgi:hypothetical protein